MYPIKMAKLNKIKVVTFLYLLVVSSVKGVEEEEDGGEGGGSSIIIDAAKRLFSLPTASHNSWTLKLKSLFPFSTPNLDFRGGTTRDEETTGKVKEAVLKSLDRSKSTVEHSAKSAAKFTVHNTLNKLKKTFSHKPQHINREEAEL